MSGTKAGGKKCAKTNMKKYGKNYYRELGRSGGKAFHPDGRGFQISGKAVEAGRKGGKLSKRGKAKCQLSQDTEL